MRFAIQNAKGRGDEEVSADDVLFGCLCTISRFGVARLGDVSIDLEPLGACWEQPRPEKGSKVAYSEAVVRLLDRAAQIARADRRPLGLEHVMAAFTNIGGGLMRSLFETYDLTSFKWRAALAAWSMGRNEARPRDVTDTDSSSRGTDREYLSPEEAAEWLGVHVQTIRGYIRTGKLPASRLAGERAIRISKENLERLLEPLPPPEPAEG